MPIPFRAGKGVVHIFGPGVDDALAAQIRRKGDLRTGKRSQSTVTEFASGDGKRGNVIHNLMQSLARYIQQGRVQLYLLYVVVTLIVLLAWSAR